MNAVVKAFLRTALGFVICFVLLNVFFTEQELRSFYDFLIIATLCTVGLPLVIIAVASYFVGFVLTIWFMPFGKGPLVREELFKENVSKEPPVINQQVRKELLSLQQYIVTSRRAGYSDEQITQALRHSGWSEEMIQEGFNSLQKQM